MKFMVMNRQQACRYAQKMHSESSVIISIRDIDDPPVNLPITNRNKVRTVCSVQFEDVTNGPYAMTQTDAQKIARCIHHVWDHTDLCIVHCTAGISRSAGICAAILKWATDNDGDIFQNPSYRPNMHCYQMMLNALKNQ